MLREIRAQIAYQRNLSKDLGQAGATRYRAATFLRSRGMKLSTFSVRPPGVAERVHIRMDTSDIPAYRQVFKREEYGELRSAGRVQTIVDCGANIGLTSVYFLNIFPDARVIAIEPDPSNANMCRRNLAPYGARATVIEAGVWSHRTRLTVQSKGAGKEWGTEVRSDPNGATEAIDIPSLGLSSIDILKVDIEGSEREMFGPTARAWIDSVRNIAIELHGQECEHIFRKALHGFKFTEIQSGELTVCLGLMSDA